LLRGTVGFSTTLNNPAPALYSRIGIESLLASDGWLSEVRRMAGQRPVAKFKAGQVSAAIWENEVTTKTGKQVTMLKATVERRYKDRDGEWKSSNSFSRNEIPFVIYCLEKSLEHIIEGQKNEDSVEEETVY
jgi:hypothetical protein